MKKAVLYIVISLAAAAMLKYALDPGVNWFMGFEGLKALAVATVMLASALGYGGALLKGEVADGKALFLKISTGLAIQSFTMMAAGFAGFVNLYTGMAIVSLGLILAVKQVRSLPRLWGRVKADEFTCLGAVAFCAVVAAIALTLPSGLLPPVFYDGLVYHLALPKYYIMEGRITIASHNFFSFFPQSVEMLYLVALICGGEIAPKALNWLLAALCFWGLYEAASESAGRKAGLWAVMIAFSMPWSAVCAQLMYIEPAIGAFFLAAYMAALRLKERGDWASIISAGALIGATGATKYTAMAMAFPLGLYALYTLGRKRKYGGMAVYAMSASALLLPWLIRNWLIAGNPVAPFYFGSAFWTAERGARYAARHASYGLGSSPFYAKIFAPLLAFVAPHLFPQRIVSLGVVPLAAALLAPVAKKWEKALSPLAIFAWGALLWTFTSQQLRLLYVPALFLCMAGAVVLSSAELTKRFEKTAAGIVLILCMFAIAEGAGAVNGAFHVWKGMLGGESSGEFIQKRVPTYNAMKAASELPSSSASTLIVGETRTYYMNRPFTPVTAWDINPLVQITAGCNDVACIKKKLIENGIELIVRGTAEEKRLIDKYGFFEPLGDEQRRLYYRFFDSLRPYYKDRRASVYVL